LDIRNKYELFEFRAKVSNVANKNSAGLILLLTQKDMEVCLWQSIKGAFKESHIQDRYDFIIRKIS
jgi:hypothetical protein